MEVKRCSARSAAKAPEEHFRGAVSLEEVFKAPSPEGTTVVHVTFEPGARNNWHSHPLGQTLIVTSGCGYVQSWEGPIRVIRLGDVMWCPPGEKHWHGASPTTGMSHIAVQEALDGRYVDWMEEVTDEQYRAPFALGHGPGRVRTARESCDDTVQGLTVRETQVLKQVVAGRTTKQIAAQLGISPASVDTYRSRIMLKLNVDNLPALVRFAIRQGITSV